MSVPVMRLLVLGAVRQRGRAHGYQVRADLEFWGAHQWSTAKPGSIYHALKQLASEGLLNGSGAAPSPAGGPPRTEYELTEDGERVFFELLRESLRAGRERVDVLTSGIGFIVDLPRAEAIGLLRERIEDLESWQTEVNTHWVPDAAPEEWGHIGEIMRMWLHRADSDIEWTRSLIERLEHGELTMAGEGSRDMTTIAPNV